MPSATALGQIHGCVSAIDKHVGLIPVVGIQADADARTQAKYVVSNVAGGVERGRNLAGDRIGINRQIHISEQYQKLISAVAAYRGSVSNDAVQPAARLVQDLVADGVAERIVDLLEVVEIHKQHSQACAVAVRLGYGLLEAIAE